MRKGIWQAKANNMEIACSAVVIALPKGVFITTTPAAVAAAISTLSTPIPARPITFNLAALLSNSGVTLLPDRLASPSNPRLFHPVFRSSPALHQPYSGITKDVCCGWCQLVTN